jgi:glutathione synthase/RimK-type ligase-like ATP-grasp enzyme
LIFSGIDIRRTPAGEYVFLEGNPSPMFSYFEKVTGYPISDRLVDLLLS